MPVRNPSWTQKDTSKTRDDTRPALPLNRAHTRRSSTVLRN
jgi:hypothetical protein